MARRQGGTKKRKIRKKLLDTHLAATCILPIDTRSRAPRAGPSGETEMTTPGTLASDKRVFGLDSDPAKVAKQKKQNRKVDLGDAEDPGFWERLDLTGIRAFLLALPDTEAKISAAKHLRSRGFQGLVSATSRYPEDAEAIVKSGADSTFNHYSEAGAGFAARSVAAMKSTQA